MTSKSLKSALLAASTALALVACGDSSTELASPGTVGPNPGTGSPTPTTPTPPPPPPTPTTVDPRHEADVANGLLAEVTIGNTVVYQLSGTLTEDLTLFSENLYSLSGQVFIGADAGADATSPAGDPAVLTVEAGTTIFGEDEGATIIVARGSQMIAEGTPSEPITFTSSQDVGLDDELGNTPRVAFSGPELEEPFVSEWGGMIINGRATVNQGTETAGIVEAEGEGDSGLYGGNDDADGSGSLRFVRVLYAGNVITSDDELNGIAFQGVGSTTTVENVQVHNNADDGIEFFGGTVNARNIVVTGSDDDSIDWTFGWRGRVENAVVVHNPNQPASDQGIEADNQGGESGNRDALPRSAPILSGLTLVGGGDVVGDIGILLRAGTAAQIYNTVVTDFADGCLDVDEPETFAVLSGGGIAIESTLLSCDVPIVADSDNGDNDLAGFFAGGANNTTGASTLNDIFVNGPTENAVTVTDVAAIDSFFSTPSAIGAVASSASDDNFTLGWTIGLNPDPTCPAGTTTINNATGCVLSGNYSNDIRLRAGLDYFLDGIVTIGQDLGADVTAPLATGQSATLTIDAGVTVTARTDDLAAIYVTRGSRLVTNGTADAPVVLTAELGADDTVDNATNLWGGVVINGRATVNQGTPNSGGITQAEGEGDSGLYGGNDDTDNSGSIRFTRIEYAGQIFTGDDELNAIAFQGVGNGTVVENLQTHNGGDDGIEFFGGTVNVKNLVITGSDDDSIDWTFGWRGRLENAVVVHNPNQPASDQGIEADNQGGDTGNRDALPRSAPILSGLTLVGGGDVVGDIGILLRAGTAAQIYNTVVTDFADGCFDVDEPETFAVLSGGGIVVDSVLLGCDTPIVNDGDNGDNDLAGFFAGGANNQTAADTLSARDGGTFTYINGATENGVTVTDVAAIDPFFTTPSVIGAVPAADEDFTLGWTIYLDR